MAQVFSGQTARREVQVLQSLREVRRLFIIVQDMGEQSGPVMKGEKLLS